MFEFFDSLWENEHCRNQFLYGETCSRIDGTRISKFIKNISVLVSLIKEEYEDTNYLGYVCDLLILLPKLTKFWGKVEIE